MRVKSSGMAPPPSSTKFANVPPPGLRKWQITRSSPERDESEIYDYQRVPLSNNEFINGILSGTHELA